MSAVFVPRLGFSVSASFVSQDINKSFEELGYQAATTDQVKVVMRVRVGVSPDPAFFSAPDHTHFSEYIYDHMTYSFH